MRESLKIASHVICLPLLYVLSSNPCSFWIEYVSINLGPALDDGLCLTHRRRHSCFGQFLEQTRTAYCSFYIFRHIKRSKPQEVTFINMAESLRKSLFSFHFREIAKTLLLETSRIQRWRKMMPFNTASPCRFFNCQTSHSLISIPMILLSTIRITIQLNPAGETL